MDIWRRALGSSAEANEIVLAPLAPLTHTHPQFELVHLGAEWVTFGRRSRTAVCMYGIVIM